MKRILSDWKSNAVIICAARSAILAALALAYVGEAKADIVTVKEVGNVFTGLAIGPTPDLIGDQFTLTITFDTSKVTVVSSNSTGFNCYRFNSGTTTLAIGGFSLTFTNEEITNPNASVPDLCVGGSGLEIMTQMVDQNGVGAFGTQTIGNGPPNSVVPDPVTTDSSEVLFGIASFGGSPFFGGFLGLSGFTALQVTVSRQSPPSGFTLQINDKDGNEISHFDFSSSRTLSPVSLKLGQRVGTQVFKVGNGTALSVSESITDSNDQSNQGPGSSTIFSSPSRELFAGQVIVHFPLNATADSHQFFPTHSGVANIHFNLVGQNIEVVLPVQVSNCSAGDCAPQLGGSHNDFDQLFMLFADRNGIPPQLLKSQISIESNFNVDAFRYEPLSWDFARIAQPRGQTPFSLLSQVAFEAWALATSNNCASTIAPITQQGAKLDLSTPDGNKRQQYNLAHSKQGLPLCRVTGEDQATFPSPIRAADTLPSMENVLYTNDEVNNWIAIAVRSNPGGNNSAQRFFDYQVDHPPFTSQTAIASSYGLHQLMYPTALMMGYKDANHVGLPPGGLFTPSTSLDLGTEYLAKQFLNSDGNENTDYKDEADFFSQFAPALRGFNGGTPDLSVADGQVGCKNPPPPPKNGKLIYACSVLANPNIFAPAPIPGGGSQ